MSSKTDEDGNARERLVIVVKVTPEIMEAAKKAAKDDRRSMSNWAQIALLEKLERLGAAGGAR